MSSTHVTRLGLWLALACCLTIPAQAEVQADTSSSDMATEEDTEETASDEPETRFSASLQTWLYSTYIQLTDGSLLNPGNRLAKVPGLQSLSDTRGNIVAEYDTFQLLLQPRVVAQRDSAGYQTDPSVRPQISRFQKEVNLTQANARLRLGNHTFVMGRELLTWGPGNFRSPSNPFYYDSGRTSPLAATPGIDLVRYTYNMGAARLSAAQVFSTDQLSPSLDVGNSQLLKLDYQGDNYLLSFNMVKRKGYADFLGGFFQYSPNDAWLLFGEFGTFKPATPGELPRIGQILNRVGDGLSQFGLFQQPPSSAQSVIAGAAYTLESGHVLTAEWLHNQGGLNRSQQQRFFNQIEFTRRLAPFSQPLSDALVGLTLLQTPPLLGRDYAWLSLQSNAQETKHYWRLEWSQSMTDSSGRLLLYAEKTFKSKYCGFIALSTTTGGPKSDFGAFVKSTVTIGVKVYIF